MTKKTSPEVVSKKAPAALKKASVKKAVAKKVAVKNSASKKVARSMRPSTSSTSRVRLGWTIGRLGVEDGFAGLHIGDTFYPFKKNTGYPICFLFPINPVPGSDPAYEAALKDAITCKPEVFRSVEHCATCCD